MGILKIMNNTKLREVMYEARMSKTTAAGPFYDNGFELWMKTLTALKMPLPSAEPIFSIKASSPESKLAAQAILEEVLKA